MLRVRWRPKDSMPVHTSPASLRRRRTESRPFFSLPSFSTWRATNARLNRTAAQCCDDESDWSSFLLTAYHILALKLFTQTRDSTHKIYTFLIFYRITFRFCETTWRGKVDARPRPRSNTNYPEKKKEIIIMPSGKRASREKMPQFICEKRETKRAQLGANLVFKAITKGNEANSLWQII